VINANFPKHGYDLWNAMPVSIGFDHAGQACTFGKFFPDEIDIFL